MLTKDQTETDSKHRFGLGPVQRKLPNRYFFGPAGLCLSLDPTRDLLENILCILSILRYFEYASGITYIF